MFLILRKPYAFLIRKFKIIHLLLTLCSVYLAYRIGKLLGFYNNFIEGTVSKLEAINYIGSFYMAVVIIAVIICFIVLLLMRYKNKSYLFYIAMIGYFISMGLFINYSCDGLYEIYFSGLDTKSLLLYRDMLKIVNLIQYIFVFLLLVRGLGFDIKKFNFVDDLIELNEDVSDDEEVELTLGGFEGANRKFNRNIRELKYYYLENKYMINAILIGFILIGGVWYLVDTKFLNPVYKTNNVFSFDSYSFNVLDSYVTNIDSNGKQVMDDGHSLVLLKINVTNNGSSEAINTANMILKVGNSGYSIVTVSSKFSDLGKLYRSQIVKDSNTLLFAYKIPDDKLKENMKLVFGNKKQVELNPIYLDEIDKVKNYKLGDNLDLSNSFYRHGRIKIVSYEVRDSFDYTYNYEVLEQSYEGNITIFSYGNTIMNLVMESEYTNNLTNYSFLSKYAKLKYVMDGKEYVSKSFEDKTPSSYKKGIYLNVDKDLEKASSIWLDIQVRNKSYIYKLK